MPTGRPRPSRTGWTWLLLGLTGGAVLGGGALHLTGRPAAGEALWIGAIIATGLPAVVLVARSLFRRQLGVDAIAVLALAGTLVVGEYLAGAVVAAMLATGRALESHAERRAARDLRALLERAPRSARRRTASGGIETVDLDAVRRDDRLLVGPHEVVAVDGYAEEPAVLDESVISGESRPVEHDPGERLNSGAVNAGPAFGMRAAATAAQSSYAGMVRLAEEATRRKAPMVRLADRYAAAFVPFTLVLAGTAWLLSTDPVRAVAVLVVATPCPLILATPIAVVSGLSRVARHGVMVRDGGSLETLGRARTLLVDKTGTLTLGRPEAARILTAPGVEVPDLLRLAASVEQLSPHVLAGAVVREATRLGVPLTTGREVTEEPGRGVSGRVDGKLVRVGQLGTGPGPVADDGEGPPGPVADDGGPARATAGTDGSDPRWPDWAEGERTRVEREGMAVIWVSVDGRPVGALLLHDPVRPDAAQTVRRLRAAGLDRLVMLTGDRPDVAAEVARVVGVDDVVARCRPEEKADRVRAESASAVTVMVGDGVNDAPALATAHVGVAMGASGATASAEVADAVLTVDRLDRLADTVEIARHARRIAVQSATIGMGLSVAAMGFAAAGLLPPVAGAFLQEGIDVLVILNALRALRGPTGERVLLNRPNGRRSRRSAPG